MNTNVDKKVAALLANDEDALRDRGRVVFSLVNSITCDGNGLQSEEERKAITRHHINSLIRDVERAFGRICVILADKNYYSLKSLASSGDIIGEDDIYSDYAEIIKHGADAIRLTNHVTQVLSSNASMDKLMLCWSETIGAIRIIYKVLDEAEKLPENK